MNGYHDNRRGHSHSDHGYSNYDYDHRPTTSDYGGQRQESPYYPSIEADNHPNQNPYNTRLPQSDPGRGNGYSKDPYGPPPQDRNRHYPPEGDTHSDPVGGSTFELDHLATFTVGSKQGLLSPEDGIKKLRQMEVSTGIWTMRVQLVLEARDLIIIDRTTGDEMERFALHLVHEPTAVTNPDRGDVYNNVVLFTVMEDPHRKAPREMHIFQCIGKKAREVVDEIKGAKEGRYVSPHPRSAPPPSEPPRRPHSGQGPDFDDPAIQTQAMVTTNYVPPPALGPALRDSVDDASVISDRTDKDVQMLNHCFDDIEKFVGRLQQAAEAFKELDRRHRVRSDSKEKNKHHGPQDGLLTMRAKPPPAKDFIDIFQKFKLGFNLLAKLKPHIHDPNAPELVHFLFTPLSLVVEASKDPRHGTPDLAAKVVAPLLTPDARDLLQNCLTSKEMDLWMSMGDSWTLSSGQWKGYVPPFYPRFDNWTPPPDDVPNSRPPSDHRDPPMSRAPPSDPSRHPNPRRVYEAMFDREGKNHKELTVRKGDILELLDDSRKWWKMRNSQGQTGHVPYTIVQEMQGGSAVRP